MTASEFEHAIIVGLQLLSIYVFFQLIRFVWGRSFKVRKPFPTPYLVPVLEEKNRTLSSNGLMEFIWKYIHSGHTLAPDTQFLLKYSDSFFAALQGAFSYHGGNIIISDGVIQELEEMKKSRHLGMTANALIVKIEEACRQYPSRFELLLIEDHAYKQVGEDRKMGRILEPYVRAQRFRLTTVVLMSQDPEKRATAAQNKLLPIPF